MRENARQNPQNPFTTSSSKLKEGTINNIASKHPTLPALPQFFDKLKPIETPELSYGKGLISGWYHEKKLARTERVSDHEARIADNRLRVTKATSDGILEALTF